MASRNSVSVLAPGVVDKDLLHGGGGRLEEMPAIGKLLAAVPGDLQPGLVDEGRSLKRLPGFLVGHADGASPLALRRA